MVIDTSPSPPPPSLFVTYLYADLIEKLTLMPWVFWIASRTLTHFFESRQGNWNLHIHNKHTVFYNKLGQQHHFPSGIQKCPSQLKKVMLLCNAIFYHPWVTILVFWYIICEGNLCANFSKIETIPDKNFWEKILLKKNLIPPPNQCCKMGFPDTWPRTTTLIKGEGGIVVYLNEKMRFSKKFSLFLSGIVWEMSYLSYFVGLRV